jgi:hypothetical protein
MSAKLRNKRVAPKQKERFREQNRRDSFCILSYLPVLNLQ